jgi:NADH:ubiquinone oxidoreductase subunit E/NAD-dependent dihydropyrimidine dehydrogenase PreA subunit
MVNAEKSLKSTTKHGSVLVIGGGISGIQSALDLADSGFKVYLVESKPSIGGVMPQLDKTFPTNDCAMCILAPKLVATGRHPNIQLVTYSDLKKIEGESGNFLVTINKRARSVDESLCNGCGLCVENCLVRFKPQKPTKQDAKKDLTKNDLETVDKIIKTHGKEPASLIPAMQEINEKYKYLPKNILAYIAQELEIPLSQVFHVATFYTSFSLKPRGKHTLRVCMGTACHVRGSPRVLDEIKRHLKIEPGQTTDDGLFTLETVNCLGACALGPVVVVDDEYYPVSSSKVEDFLKKIAKEDEIVA